MRALHHITEQDRLKLRRWQRFKLVIVLFAILGIVVLVYADVPLSGDERTHIQFGVGFLVVLALVLQLNAKCPSCRAPLRALLSVPSMCRRCGVTLK